MVTKPFDFEGGRRAKVAQQGLDALAETVDSLITIPNQRLMDVMGKDASLQDAFGQANEVLRSAVQGISELITRPGLINVDFADVRTVMSEMGQAMMGSATASGPDRALDAAQSALSSPLLEKTSISGARGILVNVTAGPDLSIGEFGEIGTIIRDIAADDATVVIGTAIDSSLGDNLRVTMVATGLEQGRAAGGGQEKPYKVVQPVQRVVNGPDISEDDMLYHRRASYDARSNADELDIPTFLRRQAD